MADYTNWLKQCVYRYEGTAPLNVYQGAGPGNTSFIFYGTAIVDETQLQDIFAQHGGKYGVRVEWMFQQKGQILVSKYQSSVDENTMMLEGLGAGAESVHFDDGDLIEVITKPNKLQDTVDIFELEDIQLLKHMLIWTPRNLIPINDDAIRPFFSASLFSMISVKFLYAALSSGSGRAPKEGATFPIK